MNNRFVKHLPRAVERAIGRFIDDQRGAVALTYALMLLTMLIALGTGMDISNALQVKYQLDLAADAGAVACGETWQSYMEQGTATALSGAEFTTLQTNANNAGIAAGVAAFQAQAGTLGVQGQSKPTFANPTILTSSSPVVTTTEPASPNSVVCTTRYFASNLNYLMQLAGFKSLSVNGASVTEVTMAPYVSVYLILDTSASMMVGSTPTDQAKVAAWVAKYDTAPAASAGTVANPSTCMVFNSCANLPLTKDRQQAAGVFQGKGTVGGHDITPCAFACHEDTTTTFHVSEMQQGEAVAQAVQAVTRFDVMKQALVNDPVTQSTDYCGGTGQISCVHTGDITYEGLLPYIRDTYAATNKRADLSTFSYNMYGFNYGIANDKPSPQVFNEDVPNNSQYFVTNQKTLPAVAAAVNTLTIGLDTHLNPPVNAGHTAVLPALVNLVGTTDPTAGACVPGTCSNNPLKFVIIMTDGLNSDRNWDCGPANCAYPPDPIPSSIKQVPSINATNYCAMWNVTTIGNIPQVGGVPLWKGQGLGPTDGGHLGQCNNNQYNPGFYLTQSPPAATSPPGANPFYSSSSPYDFTTTTTTTTAKNGSTTTNTATTTNATTYDMNGSNSVWYAGPIQTSFCDTMKKNGNLAGNGTLPGVTIAVLETPYVPMTGQDPIYYPYEGGVQSVIWPSGNPVTFAASYPTGGPDSQPMSALSQALQTCATSTNYYFQATSDAAIASGFIKLFDTYVGQWVHIHQ